MNDNLKALLEKLDLSEETVNEIQTILEASMKACKDEGKEEGMKAAKEEADKEKEAMEESHQAEIDFLKEKANEYGDYLKEKANDYGDHLKAKANEYGEHIKESVSEKMKEYADFAVEEFIAENKERFVETEEYARMKSAFDYIKEAFEKNAFDVNEDAAVNELKDSLKESTVKYESIFSDLSATREELDKVNRTLILERATADLADTQKEKVNELLEAVSFDSVEEFKDGVAMIVEQAKAANAEPVQGKVEVLNEETRQVVTAKAVDPSIAKLMERPGLF